MKCWNCGEINPAGEEFCSNCGADLNHPSTGSVSISTSASSSGSTTISASPISGSGGTTTYRALAPNSRLQNGRYLIERILGQGGMGAAMLARDTRVSNKAVVIKELISDSTDPQQRQEDVRNFEREVDTLAKIDHPLVPNVSDYFNEGSHYYMVQEYVAGENLEDRLERTKQPIPEPEALSYASQILDVLDYLEQQTPPIVHRDIKPANIIVGAKDKRAHLVDFGIARADEAKNAKRKQTTALGTQGYAPPEQYQGNADPRSDLYALAATLHHILTNRDPRDYSPFNYPPVRSVNPKLSPEIERVLNRALQIDINKRYQRAADMKRDIDDILLRRYNTQNSGSYLLGASGPITLGNTPAPASASAAHAPRPPAQQPRPQQQQPQRAYVPPPVQPRQPSYAQPGMYANPPARRQQRRQGGNWVLSSLLLLIVVLLIAALLFFLPSLRAGNQNTGGSGSGTGSGNVGATPTVPTGIPDNGIGATTVGGELVGISDGTVAFDTNRPDGQLKQQAAQSLQNKNVSEATSYWRSALATKDQSNDAEALIYLEDQRVVGSGHPYVTLVVGTMLTGTDAGVGRTNLQGAYVAQKEFDDANFSKVGAPLVRLLIANAGSGSSSNAVTVANQVVLAASKDKTIAGVMGWPFSSYAENALGVLKSAQIAMVSEAASSDNLSGNAPAFFRVVPTNSQQGTAGAQYAQKVLGAKNVVVFVDPGDSYSSTLAQAFQQNYSGTIVSTQNYTKNNAQSITTALNEALSQNNNVDLIYFAGYASDAGTLLSGLSNYSQLPNLRVLGGDALYELNYPSSASAAFNRLRFTAFAYPDEWDVQGLAARKPAFFKDYANAFDPNRKHDGSPYDYTRPQADAMLAYDATRVMLTAAQNAGEGGKTVTPAALQQALAVISGSKGIQGVTGQITFDPQTGNPVNKAFVILSVDQGGHIMIVPQNGVQGKFLL